MSGEYRTTAALLIENNPRGNANGTWHLRGGPVREELFSAERSPWLATLMFEHGPYLWGCGATLQEALIALGEAFSCDVTHIGEKLVAKGKE